MDTLTSLPSAVDTSNYSNFSSLTALKAQAREDKDAAVGQVAKQFESIFLQMMLGSMRQAKLSEGLFDGQAMEKYQDMHDKQLAVSLSENGGIGLAAVIERQLKGISSVNSVNKGSIQDYFKQPLPSQSAYPSALSSQLQVNQVKSQQQEKFDGSVKTFVEKLTPYAKKAAAALGVQPEALLAQAALETGWGKLQTKLADGSPSFNLFNIKADKRWDGDKATVSTLEYRDGVPVRENASFRAYESYEQAFDDYARFIQQNSRSQDELKNASDSKKYLKGLQEAGYATDPEYANKILNVLEKSGIKTAMQLSASINEES
jgi:flagellar protein FlgJ